MMHAYVRSGAMACPLHVERGEIDKEGNFITEGGVEYGQLQYRTHAKGEYFLRAGFMVIYIDATEDENNIVESESKRLAEAVHTCLLGMFAGCLSPLHIRSERLATFVEYNYKIQRYGDDLSHVIVVGHGNEDGIRFLDMDKPVCGQDLAIPFNKVNSIVRDVDDIDQRAGNSLQVMLLTCKSGCEKVSAELSKSSGVSAVISPSKALPMAWTIQFVAGYLANYFLKSKSMKEAVKDSIVDKDNTPMCTWEDGVKTYCPK